MEEDKKTIGIIGSGAAHHYAEVLPLLLQPLPQHDLYFPKSKPLPGKPGKIRTGPKISRNELCKCGSGNKYKKCCINKTENDENTE